MLPDVFEQQMAANRLAYEQNRDRIRLAGSGHYAAIAEGRLIVLTEDFDAAVKAVRSLRPAPVHFAVFPADEEPAFEVIDDFGFVLIDELAPEFV